jgi:hypothetical protein
MKRIVALLSVALALHAEKVVVQADSLVVRTFPDTNYGAAVSLAVTGTDHGLLLFNLSAILDNSWASSIDRAALRLRVTDVHGLGTVMVNLAATNWTESLVTYATEPAGLQSIGSVPLPTVPGTLDIPITLGLQQFLQGGGGPLALRVSLLNASSDARMVFDSKENTGTNGAPYLDVLLTGPAGPQGAQGAAGLQGPAGPKGPTGPAGAGIDLPVWNKYIVTVENVPIYNLQADCPAHQTALYGGCSLAEGEVYNFQPGLEMKSFGRSGFGWNCQMTNHYSTPVHVEIAVLCTTSSLP